MKERTRYMDRNNKNTSGETNQIYIRSCDDEAFVKVKGFKKKKKKERGGRRGRRGGQIK